MNKNIYILFLAMISTCLFARGVKIERVSFKDLGQEGRVTIELGQELEALPELSVKDNYVQVAIPGSYVWPKMEKRFSYQNQFDSKILAYQFDKEKVRVRAILPNLIENRSSDVSLSLKGRKIIVDFPKNKINNIVNNSRSPAVIGGAENIKTVDRYDESYLDKLLKEKEESSHLNKAKEEGLKNDNKIIKKKLVKMTSKDEVNMALSGTEKKSTDLSLMSYAGKFAGFLALVLLIFYAVIALFKKGAFKKGKLGFLNSSKIIEVLNTTYIGPKRSLLLIRAHEQVFLVGSSEKGLDMISEVNGLSGIFKNGEKDISGTNFDTNLDTAKEKSPTFKLKDFLNQENIDEVTQKEAKDNFALNAVINEDKVKKNKSTKVKFSQQIKNKMKELKPLQ